MTNLIEAGEDLVRERRGAAGRLYHGETAVDFYGRRWWGLIISALLLLIGTGALLTRGLNLSLDFKGGVVWTVPSKTLSESDARSVLDANGVDGARAKVQILTNNDTGLRTLEVQVGVQTDAVRQGIQQAYADKVGATLDEVSSSSVSSTWGKTITDKAIRALAV
ncbi:MAG: hypothetical protein WCK21_09555, partial [Actinomycetota bacterium]